MFAGFGHKACGILTPQPGIEPTPRIGKAKVNLWTSREVLSSFYKAGIQ